MPKQIIRAEYFIMNEILARPRRIEGALLYPAVTASSEDVAVVVGHEVSATSATSRV
jgi:hypothetical protein